ncbi:hypothetical protein C7414_11953 [Cupriavidus alkaliphilus]|nr:hypothetical protein C7414_11953 [Cupriavidus alkaliphilus]SCB34764.1 hypothetical protein GA0116996_11653 [Cupriavidus alkaliphilus]
MAGDGIFAGLSEDAGWRAYADRILRAHENAPAAA